MPLVELQHATFGYGHRAVVEAGSIGLDAGRCLGVFGPNGSGKTTLVRGLTGLLPSMAGQVGRRPGLRVGYLAQHRGIEHHWPMSGFDAAALALSARRRLGWLGPRGRRRVTGAMASLGVDDLAGRRFATLSGGQQQRLLLAGAIACDPELLVLDEPTDGLDVRSRAALLDAVRDLTTRGVGTILISHGVEDLLTLCDAVAWVHPSAQPDQPSSVEVIAPDALAERVAHARRAAS